MREGPEALLTEYALRYPNARCRNAAICPVATLLVGQNLVLPSAGLQPSVTAAVASLSMVVSKIIVINKQVAAAELPTTQHPDRGCSVGDSWALPGSRAAPLRPTRI